MVEMKRGIERSMFEHDHIEAERLVSRAEAERVIKRITTIDPSAAKNTIIFVLSWWQGELRWSRNKTDLISDRRDIQVTVVRNINGAASPATTNQIDDASLEGAMRASERAGELGNKRAFPEFPLDAPLLPTPTTKVWSDATFNNGVDDRNNIVADLLKNVQSNNMVSAGYIEVRGQAQAVYNPMSSTKETVVHRKLTQAQCSMTVRHPKGVGSGWSGLSSFDWSSLDVAALGDRALQKCLQSLNPVAVEPGRYTTILEPQAVYALASRLIEPAMQLNDRDAAEKGAGPFALEYDASLKLWRTKLGLRVIDERITISHDPLHPSMGIESQQGLRPITWIKDGILTELAYSRKDYSLPELNDNLPQIQRFAFHMSGGTISRDDMIASTKRGILVTKFSNLTSTGDQGGLVSAFTRDGLWLIENGKISKAIKNFRILEAPLFVFNQVEELGVPELVFRPNKNPYGFSIVPCMVPIVKVRDFSFTHLVDAV